MLCSSAHGILEHQLTINRLVFHIFQTFFKEEKILEQCSHVSTTFQNSSAIIHINHVEEKRSNFNLW